MNPSSTAWLDNGTYAVRQPHTSNQTDALFSQQLKLSPNSLNAQGQGAILRHHDWLYLSTWSSTTFHNIVHRLYPNNGTRESVITLDQNGCTLPTKHSSSYYGQWGFRDWVVTDDERLYAILSGYKYFYTSTANTLYHRVLEFDISDENNWVCLDSYQPQGRVIIPELPTIRLKIQSGSFTIKIEEYNPIPSVRRVTSNEVMITSRSKHHLHRFGNAV